MKMYRCFLLVVICFVSCKRSQDCPAYNSIDSEWLVYSIHDSIKFTNAANVKLLFVVQDKTTSAAYTEECLRGEPIGYYCKPCESSATMYAKSDSTRAGTSGLDIDGAANTNFHFQLFDNYASYDYNEQTHTLETADILDSILLGTTMYYQVYFHEEDTTNIAPYFRNALIWKTYYNKQFGFLGFYDRQSRSLFYRE
jgi:hypothetical protein